MALSRPTSATYMFHRFNIKIFNDKVASYSKYLSTNLLNSYIASIRSNVNMRLYISYVAS